MRAISDDDDDVRGHLLPADDLDHYFSAATGRAALHAAALAAAGHADRRADDVPAPSRARRGIFSSGRR